MHCPNCRHRLDDESQNYCVECGESLEPPTDKTPMRHAQDEAGDTTDEGDDPDGHAPPLGEPSPERGAPPWTSLFAAVTQVGSTFQGLLDDPRLRGQLPGGSLTLLGVAFVLMGLVLSVVPSIAGLGGAGTLVVLGWAALTAVNEWREVEVAPEYDGRPVPLLPEALLHLPRESQHPAVGQLFALLTCTYALLMMGYGPISWIWLLAGAALGYDQGRRYFTPLEDREAGGEGGPALHPWVLGGVALCSFSLLLPWMREATVERGVSGGEQPLAVLTQFALLLLACSAWKHRGLGGLHPFLLILLTVWLTLWFFLMKSSRSAGPWLFLPGVLMIDIVVARHLFPQRVAVEKPSSDLDPQG